MFESGLLWVCKLVILWVEQKGGRMPNVKTAISIDERLFRHVERLSDEMNVSRSQVFSKAAQLLIKRRRNEPTTDQINKALAGVDQDTAWLTVARRKHMRTRPDKW